MKSLALCAKVCIASISSAMVSATICIYMACCAMSGFPTRVRTKPPRRQHTRRNIGIAMQRRSLIFGLFAVAYFLSYFFRSANAVIAGDLRRDLGLTPEQLGLMTSLFYA